MKLRYGLVGAALLCSVSSLAFAQKAPEGFYLGIGGGVTWLDDSDFSTSPLGLHGTLDNDTGYGIISEVGYAFGNGFRVELNPGYRRTPTGSLHGGNLGGTFSTDGHVEALSGMVNVIYEYPTGTPVSPYIGGGIGVARLKLDTKSTSAGTVIDDTDTQFAYQGIVGASWEFMPNWRLALDYRYFATSDPSFSARVGGTPVSVNSEYRSNNVFLTLRYTFGPTPAAPAPTPAAAPAPAPAPVAAPIQRNFLVFFDWDKADITAEAQRVIQQAAASAKAGNVARITLTGHADRSGPERYNQKLSERRAAAVKAELVKQGIAANQIVTIGKGETQPLVPTADGVREPQNRRVEIVLQ